MLYVFYYNLEKLTEKLKLRYDYTLTKRHRNSCFAASFILKCPIKCGKPCNNTLGAQVLDRVRRCLTSFLQAAHGLSFYLGQDILSLLLSVLLPIYLRMLQCIRMKICLYPLWLPTHITHRRGYVLYKRVYTCLCIFVMTKSRVKYHDTHLLYQLEGLIPYHCWNILDC